MIRILLIASVLIFSISPLAAQTDFRPGFVITLTGDTLHGEVDYRGDILMAKLCTFRNAQGQVTEYAPHQIAAFRFTNSRFFVAHQTAYGNAFLEFLINGMIDVYYLRNSEGKEVYFIQKENEALVELPFEKDFKSVDGLYVSYQTNKHIGILRDHMMDAPELRPQIKTITRPEHTNLIRLAENYHQIVCKDKPCVVYRRDLPFLKVSFEPYSGALNYAFPEFDVDYVPILPEEDKTYFQGGVIVRFWLPRANEKFYLRSGVTYTQVSLNGRMEWIYRVPFQLEYIYPRGRVRPSLAYGLDVVDLRAHYMALVPGVKVQLIKKMHLNVSSDLLFSPWQVSIPAPRTFMGASLNAGLVFGL